MESRVKVINHPLLVCCHWRSLSLATPLFLERRPNCRWIFHSRLSRQFSVQPGQS